MMKWVWRFYSQKESLWARVIRAIYGDDGQVGKVSKVGSRSCWRNIVNEVRILETVKEVTVNSKISDSRLENSLRRRIRGSAEQVQFNELSDMLQSVSLMPYFDRWVWSLEGSREFSVASIRKIIDDNRLSTMDTKTLWNKCVPINVNILAWKIKIEALPTRFNISRRGIDIDYILCPICECGVESMRHVFFSCSLVRQIVRKVCSWWDIMHIDVNSYVEWVNWMNSLRLKSKSKLMIEGVFYVVWWHVWTFRNKLLFEDKKPLKAIIFDDVVSRSYYWCQQLEVEGDENENVPLYYYITDNIKIQFRREESVSVIFRWGTYYRQYGILQFVLLCVEGKRRIPDWMLRLANDRVGWDNYPWGSYVWPALYSQLKNANIRRWPKLYATQPTTKIDKKSYSIFRYTWAFKGNMPDARLTPDETEARSDWWISSRAYFDGGIGQAERVPRHLNRQNMYEVPSEFYRQFEEQKIDLEKQKRDIEEIRKKEADHQETYENVRKFREDMNVEPVRQANKGPIIVSQHYGISDLSEFPSTHGGPSSFQTHPNSSSFFNIGTPTNWQTPMPSQPGSSNCPIPSHMGNPNLQPPIGRHHDAAGLFDQRSPFMEQPPSTVLPKQRGNKTKKNVKKSNLSPLNLGNALDDDNEGGDDVMFLGGQFIGNYLVYENVDISKVRRENYVNYMDFLNNPDHIYLDCYMKGYLVPVTFWQQLVPHLCMPDIDSNTPVGWLSGEHMNSWMELLIRNRPKNAPWTVAYTNTISVHSENQCFLIETDQHAIGTLDGSTRPYPAWNDVNWVFMPIHVGGNHRSRV
ncbi:phospholipase-like protein [Tanacetum coccineum]